MYITIMKTDSIEINNSFPDRYRGKKFYGCGFQGIEFG
jgi:hypothetical protein